MIEKFKTIENDYISESAKIMAANASSRPNPKINEEQELLVMISKITDDKTMLEVRDLYHSQYHAYDFDTYLYLLRKLCDILLSGTPKDYAYRLIDADVRRIYYNIIHY